jgi:hypothetical protein
VARTAESALQTARSCWDRARRLAAAQRLVPAGLAYQQGLNHFLVCVNLSRYPNARSRPVDLGPVFHGLGAMGREGVPVMERAGATDRSRRHARTTLAASHLADPTGGDPGRIAAALATDGPPRLDVNGDGPLTAEARIAGAAQARLLLATLLRDRPDLRRPLKRPWPVEFGDGRLSLLVERSRFRQAVLPSCVGMTPEQELRQLAGESLRCFERLVGFDEARDRAAALLARV